MCKLNQMGWIISCYVWWDYASWWNRVMHECILSAKIWWKVLGTDWTIFARYFWLYLQLLNTGYSMSNFDFVYNEGHTPWTEHKRLYCIASASISYCCKDFRKYRYCNLIFLIIKFILCEVVIFVMRVILFSLYCTESMGIIARLKIIKG